jgi:chromate reductase, NAD(P)H dehydrogenase (quinone)
MRVLGISGSLRRESHNTRMLRGLRALLPAGVELEIFDELAAIPPYNEDDEHTWPPAVARLRGAIAGADAVLIATPEYNGSIPGQLKNALDWVSRPAGASPLVGKPAAVLGASTGLFGAVWAQAETRKVLERIGAHVVQRELPIAQADTTLGDDGLPTQPEVGAQIEAMLSELVELAAPQPLAA